MQANIVRSEPSDLVDEVRSIIGEYPESMAWMAVGAKRIAHDYKLITERVPSGGRICDVGGGYSPFAMLCSAHGYDVTVIDDFRDPWYEAVYATMAPIFERYGVRVLRENILTSELFATQRFEAITLFHILEHFHASPRPMLHTALRSLAPNGTLIIATPNCVNLRKRITVPLGLGKWSLFDAWYHEETFRGHVREPDVQDLRLIAEDLGLESVTIIGRNYVGMRSRYPLIKQLAALADPVLRLVPSICSDIYVLGRRPSSAAT